MSTSQNQFDGETLNANTFQALIGAGWVIHNVNYDPTTNTWTTEWYWGFTPGARERQTMTTILQADLA